jgi:hypothetical protein
MASYSNRYFVNDGTAGLRDFQHAARAFVDGNFALAPRLKFQHHVVFSTLGGSNGDLSIVAKSADPPKFQVTTETANQYNKKNVIMTGITYQPITIKFYDDNSGVSRKLWESYYAYTFGDHGAAKAGLYGTTLGPPATGYGLENEPVVPFLNYIKIHTFAKRSWSGYTLINPVIVSWATDNFNWTDTSPAEHTMTVAYDAVTFDSGGAGPGSPPNFGQAHYDQTPSPLQTPGQGRSPTPGVQGGQLNGQAQIFNNATTKTDPTNAYKNPTVNTTSAAENNYHNLKPLSLQGNGSANAVTTNQQAANTIGRGSLNTTAFPVYDNTGAGTVASARTLVGTLPVAVVTKAP